MSPVDGILSAGSSARSTSTDTTDDEQIEQALKKAAFHDEYRALLKKVTTQADDPVHHLELARFYIRHQYFQKAHSCLQVAKALQPRRIETHYLLGWLYQKETNWEQARITYRQILRLKPNEPLARFHLGETLLALSQKDEAYESLLKATELEPNLAPAYWHLGRLAFERKDLPRALVHFQALKNLDPANPDVYCELGHVLRAQGQIDRAILAYQKSEETTPGHTRSRVSLAELYLDGDLPDKAILILEEVVKRDVNAPEAFLLLSRSYYRVGKNPQALASLLQFQKVFPKDPRGHAELARLYFINGEQELAEEEFLKAIEIAPNEKEHYIALGTLYLNLKAPTKAVSFYRDICARFPNDPQIYSLLGEVYDRFDRFDEAVEAYGHAIQGDPRSENLYCKRAKLYVKLGQYNEALRDFEAARDINPHCPDAKLDTELIRSHKKYQEAFEFYSRAREALKAGAYPQAISHYRQVLKLVTNNADWLKEYLDVTIFTGQFSEALATFEKLVGQVPSDPELLRRYADLHYRLQNYEAARALYDRCIAVSPHDVEARIGLIRCLGHKLIDRTLSPGKFEALVTAYEAHLAASKNRNLALLELAYLHLTLGCQVQPEGQWRERAAEYLDKIGPQETEDISRHKLQALYELHVQAGYHGEVIGVLERLLRVFPHNDTFAHALLEHLVQDGQYPRAFRLSEEFKEKFPDNGLLRAKNLQLFALVAAGKENPKNLSRTKIRNLQQYVAGNPQDWRGFFDLGAGLIYLTRPNDWYESRKKANIAFNRARSLEPKSSWPWWGLVKAALHGSNPTRLPVAERDRMVSLLKSAINLFPGDPTFHYYLGMVLHRSDDPTHFEEGTKTLVVASVLGTGFAPAHFALGVHFHAAQDNARAAHHYTSVLERVEGHRYQREVHGRLRRLVP